MNMPRRMHRRLLLPPGWVALGFLLLLGCWQIRFWERQLRPVCMLQLTMPPLKANISYTKFLRKNAEDNLQIDYNPYEPNRFKDAATVLRNMRPWQNIDFYGQPLSDFLSAATTEAEIRKIIADTSHAGGVRVCFLRGATYANLISVLNIVNHNNQKKYWLDIRNYPVTLYAITDRPTHIKQIPIFSCGFRSLEARLPSKDASVQNMMVNFWKQLNVLTTHSWQATTSLLIIIATLNLWQLFHSRTSRVNSHSRIPNS